MRRCRTVLAIFAFLVGSAFAAAMPSTAAENGSVKVAAPKGSTMFTDPERRWAMRISASGWAPLTNPGFRGSFWSTGKIANGFAANVGVIVQDLPNSMSLEDFIALSETNAAKSVGDYKTITSGVVAREAGGSIGRIEYTATIGRKLHFLAYFVVRGRRAVIATYTSTAEGFASTVAPIEPYLRTLVAR
jgi:hypothetical protein